MGKKASASTSKPSNTSGSQPNKTSNRTKKGKRSSPFSLRQTSPKSKNSDTAIYYEESEDAPSILTKSSQLRKAEALHLFSGTEYPSCFWHRDRQVAEINKFVGECLRKERKGCRFLMVTGAPGLGKTLTVTTVLSRINCEVISLNSNVNKGLKEVQQIIYEKMMGKKSKSNLNTTQIIREITSSQAVNPIIVYIEEIETALSGFQSEFALEFLSLFSQKSLNLHLIGVSNSIDALERYNEKVFSLHQVTNLVFKPYGQQDIADIILERLNELKEKCQIQIVICQKLLNYVSKKLESSTKGDIRIVNEFVKDLVADVLSGYEFGGQEQCKEDFQFHVNIASLEKIFKKMESSKDALVCSLPFAQQLLLIGINAILQKQQLLYVNEERVNVGMGLACTRASITFSRIKVKDWLKQLECYSLIRVDEKKERETRITLSVSSKQIAECTRKDHQKYLWAFFTRAD